MSIKNFSNQPCATCKTDTLHFAGKCRECGTLAPARSELFAARMDARAARYVAYYGPVEAANRLRAEADRREMLRAVALKREGKRWKDLPSRRSHG